MTNKKDVVTRTLVIIIGIGLSILCFMLVWAIHEAMVKTLSLSGLEMYFFSYIPLTIVLIFGLAMIDFLIKKIWRNFNFLFPHPPKIPDDNDRKEMAKEVLNKMRRNRSGF